MSEPAFRDNLYNVDTSGRRIGFFPKKPKGRFYNRRVIVSTILLVIFFVTPWIKIGGEQFFMLNPIDRKFVIFGQVFLPQDFIMFAVLAVSFLIFILLFTAVLGRIWCGWACPQTIFLEMVYRRIEFWIEGDAAAQRRLAKAPWNADKIKKAVLKHSIFGLIAIAVSHTVLGFVLGMDEVLTYIKDGPLEHPILFGTVILNSGVFYFVFAWFREQACIYVCPYGRLQGVMLDHDSLVIAYDHQRGEPRGKIRKGQVPEGQGDCIDCKQCVAVCPTGIDIRHGTQLECVNCTACIDACDDIMDKIGKPRGLVRYASQRQIDDGGKYKLTWRAYLYGGVMTAFLIFFGVLYTSAGDLKVKLLRAPGSTYTMTPEGNVTNVFELKLINKLDEVRDIDFRLKGVKGKVEIIGERDLEVPKRGMSDLKLLVELPPEEIKGLSFELEIEVMEDGKVLKTMKTKFNGPML